MMFCLITPTHLPHFYYYTHSWDNHVSGKGVNVRKNQIIHFWQSWDHVVDKGLCCDDAKLIRKFPTFCITITIHAFDFKYWGYFITQTQSTNDNENMGIGYWSNNIGGEVHEVHWLLHSYIGCFMFNLKELGQLKGQTICIILEYVNIIFRQPYKLKEVERALVQARTSKLLEIVLV